MNRTLLGGLIGLLIVIAGTLILLSRPMPAPTPPYPASVVITNPADPIHPVVIPVIDPSGNNTIVDNSGNIILYNFLFNELDIQFSFSTALVTADYKWAPTPQAAFQVRHLPNGAWTAWPGNWHTQSPTVSATMLSVKIPYTTHLDKYEYRLGYMIGNSSTVKYIDPTILNH